MSMRITLVQGHPDPSPERFCRALAEAYRQGAEAAGHRVQVLDVADLALPPLQSQTHWQSTELPDAVAAAQRAIEDCQHLVIIYPLWLGDVPAALKAFFEQVFRPGFAFHRDAEGKVGAARLGGRSARVIVTMGMPALFYRVFYRAHSLKSLSRNILRFCGFGPVRSSVFGLIEGSAERRRQNLDEVRRLGSRAE